MLFSCIKVLHSDPKFYCFSTVAFKKVADKCWEFDNIAEANEVQEQYIAYIYGKSKSHFKRIAGILWVLELAFKVLNAIDPIPSDKNEFIAAVLNIFSTIDDSSVINIHIVNMAALVTDYFIDHKLILSDMERDENSTEYKFINNAIELSRKKSMEASMSNIKAPISLETRILTTPGISVLLTPLSRAHFCNKSEFVNACTALSAKQLGKMDEKFLYQGATRVSLAFTKSTVPKETEQNTIFVNALFDYNCSIEVYSETLSQAIIIPLPSTLKSDTKENSASTSSAVKAKISSRKRLLKETSCDNITNLSKANRSDSANLKEGDSDSSSNS